MMGLGFLGSSSSSSESSNLSPLAPPFTVDRSNYLISNPVAHFDWPYSHPSTARQDFLADSIRTATVPCVNGNGCMSPKPISPHSSHTWSDLNPSVEPGFDPLNPPGIHWSAVNTSLKPAIDLFSSNVSETKPYYPPYASSVTNIDIPSVALDNYELLSTSDLINGDGPSQFDYTQSLSGLEYNSQWHGGKQGNRLAPDASFFSEEANFPGSLASKHYINQGACGTETMTKEKEDSAMFPGSYADVFRRENHIGPPINDGTLFTAKNHSLVPNEISKAPAFRAFPMFSESHPLVPSFEPPEEPWNSQESYTLPEKRFHMFDPSITNPSHSLVIKPPDAVSNFSTQGKAPTKSVEIGNFAAFDSGDVVGSTHNPLKEKELHLSLGFESERSFIASNQPSLQIGRTDEHTFVVPSSTREELSNKLSKDDQLYFEFKARSNHQVPDINNPNFNSSEDVTSAVTSSEHFDHHNPAEDSPCWKGAPTSHFSHTEAESPQHPTKKLQTSNGVNLQGSQTDQSFHHSSKVSPSELREISNFSDVVKPRNGYDVLGESTNDARSQISQSKLPNLEDDVLTSKMKTRLPVGVEDPTIHSIGNAPLLNVEDAANLETAGKNNVNILVKTLHNLLELLLLHCSNDKCALKEQDCKALDHIVANLEVCMSRKIPPALNFGRSIEKSKGFAYPRDNADLPKDYGIIQAIKKILDENLECKEEIPSQTLLYKNLWLEAEAELCVFNYRARFERMKKGMENCNSDKAKVSDASESTSAIKRSSSSNCSPDMKISPIPTHEADDSKISNTRVQNPPFSSVDSQIDNVESSVMARLNILKCRGESNPIDVETHEPADVEASGVTAGPHLQHNVVVDDEMHSLGNQMMWNQFGPGTDDVEPSVMARLNVLKHRNESNPITVEEQELADAPNAEVIDKESLIFATVETHFMHQADKEDAVAMQKQLESDWEHILMDEISWQTNGRISR